MRSKGNGVFPPWPTYTPEQQAMYLERAGGDLKAAKRIAGREWWDARPPEEKRARSRRKSIIKRGGHRIRMRAHMEVKRLAYIARGEEPPSRAQILDECIKEAKAAQGRPARPR